jgi:small-conductance mechanosensitive channel
VDLGTAVASSWSAGISVYGVLAALGIAGRLDYIDVSKDLEQTWVIAVLLGLFAFEFVVDKISFLDSGWDAINTVIRPVAGAYIMTTAPDQEIPVLVSALIGGALAFSSHSAKASTRALVNTSPEPASNVLVSTAEDGLVAAVMALAFTYPEIALAVTVVLVVFSSVVAVVMAKFIIRLYRRFRAWRERRAQRSGRSPAPPP